MLKLPYGISNFAQIRGEEYFYVDRTRFISYLENAGKQLLFLRPRRFGKSVLLSTLENYYDVARANNFYFGQGLDHFGSFMISGAIPDDQ